MVYEKEISSARLEERVDPREGFLEGLLVFQRFGEGADGRHPQSALSFVFGGDEVNGDMARGGLVFETGQDSPAVNIGQVDIQSDGVRVALAHRRQCVTATRGDQPFPTGL